VRVLRSQSLPGGTAGSVARDNGRPKVGGIAHTDRRPSMDIRTISRTAAAAALVIGPLTLAVPIKITDDEDAPAAQQLRDYAAHAGAAKASNVALLALLLLVPAMLATARLARRGAPKLAFAGGALASLGWLAGLIAFGGQQIALYQGAKLADRAGAAALIDGVSKDPVFGTLIGVFVLGHIVGMIILGVALWRSRAVPVWAAGLFVAYPILHFVGHAVSPAVDYAGGAALLVSAVVVAARIMRTPNEQWDAPARDAAAAAGAEPAARPVAAAR
jgi:hypothetical protein